MTQQNKPILRFKNFSEDWEQRKFSKIVNRVSKSSDEQNLPRVEYEDIVSGEGVLNKDIFEKSSEKKGTEFLPGDTLYGKLRPYLKNWLYTDFKGIAVGDFWVLRPLNSNDEFVYSLIQSDKYQLIANQSSGTKMPRSDWSTVSNTDFFIPKNMDEQKKIGEFFKALENSIALHQRKLELLKEQKTGFLQKMFPKNGSNVPEIRFSGFTEDWEQRKLGEMVKEFSVKSKMEDEHTVLSSTNSGMEIREGRVSGVSNLGYKIIDDGDLVLSPQNLWLGNININDIGIGLVSPSYKTFKITNVDSLFLKPQLHTSKMLEEYKNSSTQGASVVRRNLELDAFYQILMHVPNVEEQIKIGAYFKHLDDSIALHQKQLEVLKETKKSLLQKMFV